MLILDNCEHVLDAAAALAVRLLDAAPGLRILCTSQVPLDVDGEAVFELAPLALADAVELFTRRAAAPAHGEPTTRCASCAARSTGCRWRSSSPRRGRKTLSIEEITRRLDDRFSVLSDPASRRPERRRALQATIGWSYELLFPDDQRGLWALATFAGGAPLPAVESVLEALDVPASAAIDVVGRLASRSLVIVDDGGDAALPAARQHPRVRARGDGRGRADRARPRRARGVVRRRGRARRPPACAAPARPSTSRSPAPSAPTSTPRWPGARRTTRCSRSRIVNGFGWAWIVLGDSRGAQRILAALAAAGEAAPARDRASALLLAALDRGVDRRPRARARATSPRPPSWPTRSTTSTCRRAAATTSPTSCRTTASGSTALELTDRSARRAGAGLGPGREPPPAEATPSAEEVPAE